MDLGATPTNNVNFKVIDAKIDGGVKAIQISLAESLYELLCKEGLGGKVLKDVLKNDITVLIDTVVGSNQTFIHYEKDQWKDVYKWLYHNGYNRIFICDENFVVHDSLMNYLHT